MSGPIDDLAQSVRGDLNWLRTQNLAELDESGLREMSGRLRRLLIEGTMMRYRKSTGLRGEPRITFHPLDGNDDRQTFSQSGGIERGGVKVGSVSVFNEALSPEEIKARYEAGKDGPPTLELPLSRWLTSPCLRVEEVVITPRDIIKYVANKLGGVHFDERRDPSKEAGYLALDRARSLRLLDLDAVYGQLTAIGQQLLAAPDVAAIA
jgi:hypothetical protein